MKDRQGNLPDGLVHCPFYLSDEIKISRLVM
jgi:hypothetical protein